ncbi:tetratricopeptide repeat protein [Flavitalea antarctica]
MNKVLLCIVLILFSAQRSPGQQDGITITKAAGEALSAYRNDPLRNIAKLEEARKLIEQSLITTEAHPLASAWLMKGHIYLARVQSDMEKRQVDPKTTMISENDALTAFDAYKKAYRSSRVEIEKSGAIKGIGEVQGHLLNIGVKKYEGREYEKSFFSISAALESHAMLKEAGLESLLDEPKQLEELMYVAGVAAVQANRCPEAMVLYNKLLEGGTDRPGVYEGIYHCKGILGDEPGAAIILSEGRKKFPNDTGLLFAEVNAYLKAGKLEELIASMEQAIRLEPDNIELYVTTGNVYDNLSQSAYNNRDEQTANTYFEKAKRSYSIALSKHPENPGANYGVGSLYYNKAAILTQELNLNADDFSVQGIDKRKALKDQIMSMFGQALPYFRKVESIDANDINSLIALSEIYARKEDSAIAEEMKRRLEIVKNGGRNSSSYFQPGK